MCIRDRCNWSFTEHLRPVIVARPGIDWRHCGESLFDVQMRAGNTGDYPTFIDIDREQVAALVWAQPLQLMQAKRGSALWREHFT